MLAPLGRGNLFLVGLPVKGVYQVLASLCDDNKERAVLQRYRLISPLTEMHSKQLHFEFATE
jgi:hypothetical protein